MIDRITSATYGRTFTIDEADCDISLPDVPDTVAAPVNGLAIIDQFQYLIQIIKILGYIIQNTYYVKARESAFSQNMNGIITTLEKKLSTWLESLPPELQSQSNHTTGTSASVAKCQLHMFYHAAVVLLYRPMIPAAKQPQDSHQSPFWARCSTAANAIVDIAQGMLETGKLRYVHNYLIYAIFTGAIIFVHNASSAMDREMVQDSKNRIHMIMKFFNVIERTWNTAARSSSILGGLLGVRDIDLEQRPPQYKTEGQEESFAMTSGPSTSFERHRGSPQQWLQKRQGSDGGVHDVKTGAGVEQMQGTTEPYSGKQLTDVSQRPAPQGPVYDHPVETSATGYTFSPAQSQMGLGQSMDAGSSTMDPFAAPGTVLGPSHTNYDPLSTAFWGVPSSLDIEEWNSYLGSQGMQQQQQQQPPPQQQQQGNPDSQMQMYRQPNNNSQQPMVPGSHLPALPHMQAKASPGVDNMTVPPKMPPVPANSSLFNYYNNDLSKSPGYQRQDNNTNTSNMMYW